MAYQPKSYRKFLVGSVSAALVASAVGPVAASAAEASYTDVSADYWAHDEIMALSAMDIVGGYSDETFKPGLELNRGQAAVMFSRALDLTVTDASGDVFTDLSAESYFAPYAEAVEAAGVFGGYADGSFGAGDSLTREQMASVLVRAFDLDEYAAEGHVALNDIDSVSPSHRANVQQLADLGITKVADGNYRPKETVTRAQFSVFLYRVIDMLTVEVPANTGVAGFITLGGVSTEGVKVSVDGQETLTDADGYFSLETIPSGEHQVTISKTGYETKTFSVEVFDGKASALIQDLALITRDNIEVETTVVDSVTGAPVVNAAATLEKWNQTTEEWEEVTLTSGVTDANGLLDIVNSVDAGGVLNFGDQLRLMLSKEYASNLTDAFYSTDWIEFTLTTDAVTNVLNGVELVAVESATVSGEVTGTDGNPLGAGQNVDLIDQDGETVLATVVTDANGAYSFADYDLPTGTYYVKVVTAGTEAIYVAPVQVKEGTDVTHDVQLEAGYTVDYTVAPEGVGETFAAGDYTVKLIENGAVFETGTVTAVADAADVTFNLTNIPAGDYTVEVSGNYILPESFSVSVTDQNVTDSNRVEIAGMISGTVTPGEATLNLLNASDEVVATTEAEAGGTYSFGSLVAGDYKVEAAKSGFVTDTTDALTVAKKTNTNGDITLSAVDTVADVAGYVRTEGSLSPATSATVSYYAVSVDGYDAGEFVTADATIDTTGQYALTGLTPGVYQVVIRDAGNHEISVSTVTVTAGDDITDKNYTLAEGGDASLAISLVDSEGNEIDAEGLVFTANTLEDEYVDSDNVADTAAFTGSVTNTADVDTVDFSNLASGTYSLALDANGYQAVNKTVTIEKGASNEVTITLTEDAAMHDASIRVIDENNADVNDAKVVALDMEGNIVATFTGGTNGYYTLTSALVDGSYTAAAYKDGYVVPTVDFTVEGANVTITALKLDERY